MEYVAFYWRVRHGCGSWGLSGLAVGDYVILLETHVPAVHSVNRRPGGTWTAFWGV